MKRYIDKYNRARKLVREVNRAMYEYRISPEEDRESTFTTLLHRSPEAYAILCRMSDEKYLAKELKTYADTANDEKPVQVFIQRLEEASISHIKNLRRWRIAMISAVVVLLAITTGLWIMIRPPEKISPFIPTEMSVPVLITQNGRVFDLNAEEDQFSLLEESITVEKTGLRHDAPNDSERYELLNITRVIVPDRYTYNVTFEDGTSVMLNANSELSYPLHFGDERREITLQGEGMFEVTADPQRPFIVNSGGLRLKVYGTRFNINTNRSGHVEVLLVNGSLGVSIPENDEIMLEPNQLLSYTPEDNRTEIKYVDPESILSWCEGYFMTELQEISDLLDDISSWYGVSFLSNSQKVLKTKVSVMIGRDMEIDALLETLQLAAGIRIMKVNDRCYEIK